MRSDAPPPTAELTVTRMPEAALAAAAEATEGIAAPVAEGRPGREG